MIIGVTGSIGSGKSTFSKFLRDALQKLSDKSLLLIDADSLAKELIDRSLNDSSPDSISSQLRRRFGDEIIAPDGSLNRELLADKAFKTKENADALNNIVHPFVAEALKSMIKDEGIFILDVPLLFESGIDSLCDRVITVIAGYNIRRERAKKFIDFDLRDSFQLPIDEKSKRSDYVIENNGSIDELKEKAWEIAKKILI